MQLDFHYYATICAAYLAGYSFPDSVSIGYNAQLVDCCSKTFLARIKGPRAAATTQSQLELADISTDLLGLQDITRIWASFHFIPGNLYSALDKGSRRYRQKFHLICDVNGTLLAETVNLAKDRGIEAAGLAMHVLADTWAHRFFAGTPSFVINNTGAPFTELIETEGGWRERPVHFRHNPTQPDDLEQGYYTNTMFSTSENGIMNLGHGRAGHLPDLSFMRYRYMPAWGGYALVTKDNPSDYMHAFRQMVYALRFLRGEYPAFETCRYDRERVTPYSEDIRKILTKRQTDSSEDWKMLMYRISGEEPEKFDIAKYEEEYIRSSAENKNNTVLGRFILAALRQKSMVTKHIFASGNFLAGLSVDFEKGGFRGIRDFRMLLEAARTEGKQ